MHDFAMFVRLGDQMTKLWLIGAGVLLGGLLTAAVIVALLEREDTLPEGSPEAAVQSFLLSLEDDDFEASYDFLSAGLKEDCEIDDLFGSTVRFDGRPESDRITLDKTTLFNGTAVVTVRLTQFRGSGPFGSSESSHLQRYSLVQEDSEWKFKEYPWPLFRCGPFTPVPEFRPLPEIRREPVPPRPVPAPTAEPAPKPTPSSRGPSR